MVISILAPSFFSYPLWAGGIFEISFIVGSTLLYICFHRMIVFRAKSILGIKNPKPTEVKPVEKNIDSYDSFTNLAVLSDETQRNIEQRLKVWIDQRCYLNKDVTINSLSKELYTNRTYLSKYINTKYGNSFRTWITNLRIEEAKRLLSNYPDMQITEVSNKVGAASQESFTQTFSNYVGKSPSKWREEQSTVSDTTEEVE